MSSWSVYKRFLYYSWFLPWIRTSFCFQHHFHVEKMPSTWSKLQGATCCVVVPLQSKYRILSCPNFQYPSFGNTYISWKPMFVDLHIPVITCYNMLLVKSLRLLCFLIMKSIAVSSCCWICFPLFKFAETDIMKQLNVPNFTNRATNLAWQRFGPRGLTFFRTFPNSSKATAEPQKPCFSTTSSTHAFTARLPMYRTAVVRHPRAKVRGQAMEMSKTFFGKIGSHG